MPTQNKEVLLTLLRKKAEGKKSFTLLIDPDKFDADICQKMQAVQAFDKIDFVFVGGSLINGATLGDSIQLIKQISDKPVIIFPGSNMHIDRQADAILFLSLISGRNPDLLIGQHIVAAPILKQSGLEILSTAYMLIDGGRQTTVSYISNTTPIPRDKPEVAACTAMAGELLGLSLLYADAGSGAQEAISPKIIQALRKAVEMPIIIGGGIRTAAQAQKAYEAGADMVVIGNAIEERPELIDEVHQVCQKMNK